MMMLLICISFFKINVMRASASLLLQQQCRHLRFWFFLLVFYLAQERKFLLVYLTTTFLLSSTVDWQWYWSYFTRGVRASVHHLAGHLCTYLHLFHFFQNLILPIKLNGPTSDKCTRILSGEKEGKNKPAVSNKNHPSFHDHHDENGDDDTVNLVAFIAKNLG